MYLSVGSSTDHRKYKIPEAIIISTPCRTAQRSDCRDRRAFRNVSNDRTTFISAMASSGLSTHDARELRRRCLLSGGFLMTVTLTVLLTTSVRSSLRSMGWHLQDTNHARPYIKELSTRMISCPISKQIGPPQFDADPITRPIAGSGTNFEKSKPFPEIWHPWSKS
jgi:hypothetical protein